MAVSMKGSRRFDDGGSNELIKPVLDAFDVLGDPIKRADYYGKPGAPTTILEEPTTDTRIRRSSQISGVSVSNALLACTEDMASVAFKHMQKCQEDTMQKFEAAKTEAVAHESHGIRSFLTDGDTSLRAVTCGNGITWTMWQVSITTLWPPRYCNGR